MKFCCNRVASSDVDDCGVNLKHVAKSVWRFSEIVRSCSEIGCTTRDIQKNRAKGIKFYKIAVKPGLWLAAMRIIISYSCSYSYRRYKGMHVIVYLTYVEVHLLVVVTL